MYLPDTEEVRALLQKHGRKGVPFVNQVEGGTWLDVHFAYRPWWDNRTGRHKCASCGATCGDRYRVDETGDYLCCECAG